MPSISDIINIAKISQYLSSNVIEKSGLNGGGVNKKLPHLLYCVRKNVEWAYGNNVGYDGIQAAANYLYALCAPFNIQANYILNNGVGGVVLSPINPPNFYPDPLDFEVTASSIILQGESTLDLSNYGYVGFNILFFVGHIQQSKVDDGGAYYAWDKNTAILTLFNRTAQLGDIFTIYPVV